MQASRNRASTSNTGTTTLIVGVSSQDWRLVSGSTAASGGALAGLARAMRWT